MSMLLCRYVASVNQALPIVFQRNWPRKFPRNSREIGCFFREFVPENPAKFDFFFRDLPEALSMVGSQYAKSCHVTSIFIFLTL